MGFAPEPMVTTWWVSKENVDLRGSGTARLSVDLRWNSWGPSSTPYRECVSETYAQGDGFETVEE